MEQAKLRGTIAVRETDSEYVAYLLELQRRGVSLSDEARQILRKAENGWRENEGG